MREDARRKISFHARMYAIQGQDLAERVGIEPTVPLPGQQFSRLPDSATLAPLHFVEPGRRQENVWGKSTVVRINYGGSLPWGG